MNKSDFIKWLVKKEKEAGVLQSRFVKIYRNSEDHWTYHTPGVDCLETRINLETDGKVIYTYDKNLYGGDSENSFKEKEFTYDEFVNTNIDELE